MKKLIVLLALLSGCTTNGQFDAQETWTLIGVVVVGGAIAASQSGGGGEHSHNCGWIVGPNGSTPAPC